MSDKNRDALNMKPDKSRRKELEVECSSLTHISPLRTSCGGSIMFGI